MKTPDFGQSQQPESQRQNAENGQQQQMAVEELRKDSETTNAVLEKVEAAIIRALPSNSADGNPASVFQQPVTAAVATTDNSVSGE